LKTENFIAIWVGGRGCSWCCWKAIHELDLIELEEIDFGVDFVVGRNSNKLQKIGFRV
jgi:hypothetical protein